MKKVIAVILFILFCLFIRIAVGELCIVPSGSMEPTLLCGDRVWIDKITYGARFPARWADIPVINVFTWIRPLRKMDRNTHWKYRRLPGIGYPEVGDIVVFNSPESTDQLLVKRITRIKKKNDTLHVRRDNYLFLRKLIAEEGCDVRMGKRSVYINGICDSIYRLKRTYYYVEGDNSADSRDSRCFGYIPETLIVGKFNYVLFSVNNLGNKGKKIRFGRFFYKITR